MMAFGRTIDFELEMQNAADAAKVQIIQYFRDEIYKIRVGTPNVAQVRLTPIPQPNPDPGWQWQPGADGWTVDSEDTNRCWPEAGITRAGRKVSWHDFVSTGRRTIQRKINDNELGFATGANGDFPHELTTLYKTDIFCSERDVCNEVVAQNQETPIASVTWRQYFKMDVTFAQGQWWIQGTVAEITIDQIDPQVYQWCPTSPHRPV